jgi:hypothetical protein
MLHHYLLLTLQMFVVQSDNCIRWRGVLLQVAPGQDDARGGVCAEAAGGVCTQASGAAHVPGSSTRAGHGSSRAARMDPSLTAAEPVTLLYSYMLHPTRSGNPNHEPTKGSKGFDFMSKAGSLRHALIRIAKPNATVRQVCCRRTQPLKACKLGHCCMHVF